MWKATLDDGSTATEESGTQWGRISGRVRELGFVHRGVEFSLPPDQKEYLQAKSAAAPLCGGEIQVESRWIGFRTGEGKVFRLRFHEKSGDVSVEIE